MTSPVPTADRTVGAARLADLVDGWRGGGTAYTALADGIRAAVLAGALPTRSRVPSERDLASALGVSRTTVTATYDLLRSQGYLVSRRGSGTVTVLPAGATRAPTFGDRPDDRLLDLTKAAPAAPPELATACTAAVEDLRHHLGGRGLDPLGLPVLREAVAAWYRARGVPTTAEQILVTAGAQQAIHLLAGVQVRRGERVLVEHPTYPHAIEIAATAGGRPVPVPVGPTGVDVDLLTATARRVRPSLVYLVPDHHNPTGTVLDPALRGRVRHEAARTGGLLVVDEVFADLTLTGQPAPSLLGPGTDRHVVGVGSASKSFWSGLRVGWVRAHPDLVAALAARRATVDLAGSVLDQLVVMHLLAVRSALLARRREQLRGRRDLLVDLLARRLPGWRVDVPDGGLSLWVDLGAPVSTALALRAPAHGVHLVPGTAFGVDGSFDDRLRLTFAEPEEVLVEAVERIAATAAGLGAPSTCPVPDWSGAV